MQEKPNTPPDAAVPEQQPTENMNTVSAESAAASAAFAATNASADAPAAGTDAVPDVAAEATVAAPSSAEKTADDTAMTGDAATAAPTTADTAPLSTAAQTATAGDAATEQPCAPSAAEKLFHTLTPAAPLVLLLLLFAQCWMWLLAPALYAPCEEPTLSLLQKTLSGHLWLTPMTDTMAALPVYPWLAGLLALLPLPAASVYSLLALTGAALLLLGTWGLGRACGLGAGVSFASGCLLLASLLFPCMAHTLGAETVTAGLMACALAALIQGWKKDHAWISLPLGFICTALAGMSGGIIPFAIPLVASLLFVLWTGRVRRAQHKDALAGFALMLLLPLGWVAAIIFTGGHGAYLSLLVKQLLAPFSTAFWPPADPLEQPALVLLCALAPWPVLLLFTSWGRVLGSAWTSLKASRKEQCGHAWLWICLFAGLACCMLASTKPLPQALVLLPVAALLLTKALCRLSPFASRIFFCLLAAAAFLSALALTAFTLPFIVKHLPFALPALAQKILTPTTAILTVSAVLLIACVLLGRFTCKGRPCGALLVTTLLSTLLMQPVGLMLAPALNGVIGKPLAQLTAKPAVQAAPAAPATQTAPPAMKDTATDTPKAKPAQDAPAAKDAPAQNSAAEKAPAAKDAPTKEKMPAAAPAQPATSDTAAAQPTTAERPQAPVAKEAPAKDIPAPATVKETTPAAPTAAAAPEVAGQPAANASPKTPAAAPEAAPAPVDAPATAPAQPASAAPVQSAAPETAPAASPAPAAPAAQ